MLYRALLTAFVVSTAHPAFAESHSFEPTIEYGPRPFFLIAQMKDSLLKEQLLACQNQTPTRTDFSIGHRGAPLMFPEHTVESNIAAARQGAGILECDVTFTSDNELVCRHAQNDLHTTTTILTSDLANRCVTPFTPAQNGSPASAECRTSELTLSEFETLTPKMDAANRAATTPEDYLGGTADWRTDLYVDGTSVMTHTDSIALFRALGAKFTPELKSPEVEMPFNGMTQSDYAQKLVDAYKEASVPASDVWLQSFNLDDVLYWLASEPEFGAQAVFLDASYTIDGFDPMNPSTFARSMQSLADQGVRYIAPPLWMLITLENGKIVPSAYANEAKAAGLNIITWTLERSGPLKSGGGWYFRSVTDAITNDGDTYEVLHVLAQDVGVKGVFSDWPATVTYYANCMGL
ncbi:MAG: glycerophosphodiester phosphodiesterase family protein [Paracoccaceae bacterium]